MKYTDRNDWYELWRSDKDSIITTMVSNLHADLQAGYQPTGDSVGRQLATIADYRFNVNVQVGRLLNMSFDERNRWCFNDLLKRGAIA